MFSYWTILFLYIKKSQWIFSIRLLLKKTSILLEYYSYKQWVYLDVGLGLVRGLWTSNSKTITLKFAKSDVHCDTMKFIILVLVLCQLTSDYCKHLYSITNFIQLVSSQPADWFSQTSSQELPTPISWPFSSFLTSQTMSTMSDYPINPANTSESLNLLQWHLQEVAKCQHVLEVSTNNILVSLVI